MRDKEALTSLLALADIKIDGKRPFDIQVHDDRLYRRVLRHRELGLGEAYMDGWWDTKQLDVLVEKILSANVREKIKVTPAIATTFLMSFVLNRQTKSRASKNASFHYNIGNDLYERMLGKRMMYSCAYWNGAKNLDEAQEAKLDLICRKLQLKRGLTLLDIGCGWGGFAEFAAKNYGVVVTGITPAKEQVKLAKKRVEGLNVKILQKDYRDLTGSFDRIVSIGMLEHVGPKNYRQFFKTCNEHLNDGGLMLHHTIGLNSSTHSMNPWLDKYIFPGGVVPSLTQISKAVEKLLIIEDVHNIGPDYDKTLMAWYANFAKRYPEIKDHYDERFYRMWTFYLLICAGAFRARHLQLWQVVMRKIQPSDKYVTAR
ncbi:MAG TPA: cyclopropane fatty acyl phospholipid synthase [Candidatus Saccharimonadales bacterium]|nr:cyclopropane fatty acyl phospholipid synthase [Candidatus Saccharimonadales bacterium]